MGLDATVCFSGGLQSESFGPRSGRRGYRGEVDFFGVFCPELNKTYLVPVEAVPVGKPQLRVDPPKVMSSKFNWAEQYEI